jgi:hypothetical protein
MRVQAQRAQRVARCSAWRAAVRVRTLDLTSVGRGLALLAYLGGGALPCHLPVVALLYPFSPTRYTIAHLCHVARVSHGSGSAARGALR